MLVDTEDIYGWLNSKSGVKHPAGQQLDKADLVRSHKLTIDDYHDTPLRLPCTRIDMDPFGTTKLEAVRPVTLLN